MAGLLNDNYSKSLAGYLFKKIEAYQSNDWVKRYVPKLSGSNLYITQRKIEQWIKEHNDK
tara:strand:+ start:4455 stop:4634 length:180 start_codon:yes stop_codon:yes gene_type:complete